jgi:hypothetical protein
MRTNHSIAGAIATAIALGTLVVGSPVAKPAIYHDTMGTTTTQNVVVGTMAKTAVATVDIYHDT